MNGIKAEIVAALAALALVLGAAGGWFVNGWRLGNTIERLQGKVNLEDGANSRCALAVADVRTTIDKLGKDQERRAGEVKSAVAKAAADSKAHLNAAQEALNRAAPQPGAECETAAREAREYIERRRGL